MTENLESKLDNLLEDYSDSYLIPSKYDGYILWELDNNISANKNKNSYEYIKTKIKKSKRTSF